MVTVQLAPQFNFTAQRGVEELKREDCAVGNKIVANEEVPMATTSKHLKFSCPDKQEFLVVAALIPATTLFVLLVE